MMQRFSISRLVAIPLLAAGVALHSGAVLADGAANDSLACYKWDQFPDERLNLGVRNGGPLSSPQDASYDHPAQRTHGVHAKHVGVCGKGTSGSAEGVVLVAAATGARMGLHTMASRDAGRRGGRETCRPVFLDCFSEEANKVPEQWTCRARNEFGVYFGESTLTLVALDAAHDDPLCAVFEGDDTFKAPNMGRGRASASGTLRTNRGRQND